MNISISKEPILFCGTLRHNLDPFERFTNIDIYKALLLIEYKSAFSKGLGNLNRKYFANKLIYLLASFRMS